MSGLKKLLSIAAAAALGVSMAAVNVSALEAYEPYSYDRWGDAVPSQAGYTAEYIVDGNTIGCGAFSEPSDIYFSHDHKFYIADSKNNRIVVTDVDFNLVGIIDELEYDGKKEKLKAPAGVYVDQYTKAVYICDTENERVIKCDENGKIDRFFEKPSSELFSEELTFNPKKVITDKAGNVYVVVQSVTKGAVMYDSKGEFLGYYGANRVEATSKVLWNAFWNTISTEEQRARSVKSTPTGFTSFDIDDEGFIYTVTASREVKTDAVKKLNPKGANILETLGATETTYGDNPPAYYSLYSKESQLTDIDIGPNGEINILDFVHGRVFQYDKLANLMFIMGGQGEQLGTFRSAQALETYDNKIYVIDALKNNITVFRRTAFGEIVTKATNLYNEGFYEESYEPWKDVLKYDGNYRRAYIGIGNALFQREDYKNAMKYYKVAISRKRYNKAYEGYRNLFLKKYFSAIVVFIVVIIVFVIVYKRLKAAGKLGKKRRRRL